jgi:hypothetical protein
MHNAADQATECSGMRGIEQERLHADILKNN